MRYKITHIFSVKAYKCLKHLHLMSICFNILRTNTIFSILLPLQSITLLSIIVKMMGNIKCSSTGSLCFVFG